MSTPVTRPPKFTHLETILYEIYMLRFALDRLNRASWEKKADSWSCLETYLLHYRNLIEFLGKQPQQIKTINGVTDLNVNTIWGLAGVPAPPNLAKINSDGAALLTKYEYGERISAYLAHCTDVRTDGKDWKVAEMQADIELLLGQIEPALGPCPAELITSTPSIKVSVVNNASTMSGTTPSNPNPRT
jgi:hypothetical protein